MNPDVLSAEISVYPIVFMASFLIWIMFVGLFIVWFTDGSIRKENVLHALGASTLAWVMARMIKEFFPTLRPYQLNGDIVLTITKYHEDGAFPSAHTAVAFAIAVTIWLHNRRIGWIFIFLAILVGLGRVMSNVHFPIDILGGAIVGSFVAVLFDKFHMDSFVPKKRK